MWYFCWYLFSRKRRRRKRKRERKLRWRGSTPCQITLSSLSTPTRWPRVGSLTAPSCPSVFYLTTGQRITRNTHLRSENCCGNWFYKDVVLTQLTHSDVQCTVNLKKSILWVNFGSTYVIPGYNKNNYN